MKHTIIDDHPALVFESKEDYQNSFPTNLEENTVLVFTFIKNSDDLVNFLHFDRKNSLDYSREFGNAPAETIADWLIGSEDDIGRAEFTDRGMIDYLEV